MRFVVVEAEEQDLKQEATQPLLSLLQALTQIPPSTDALVTARLSELMTNSFGVFQVEPKVVDAGLPGLLQTSFHVEPVDVDAHQAGSLEREGKRRRLSCNKALVVLVSSKRTEQKEAASGLRLVTKAIIDGLAEADAAAAEKFTAIACCTVHNLKDFVLDPPWTGKKLQYALAIASPSLRRKGKPSSLREADVDVATKCMRQLLLMSIAYCYARTSAWHACSLDRVDSARLATSPLPSSERIPPWRAVGECTYGTGRTRLQRLSESWNPCGCAGGCWKCLYGSLTDGMQARRS